MPVANEQTLAESYFKNQTTAQAYKQTEKLPVDATKSKYSKAGLKSMKCYHTNLKYAL